MHILNFNLLPNPGQQRNPALCSSPVPTPNLTHVQCSGKPRDGFPVVSLGAEPKHSLRQPGGCTGATLSPYLSNQCLGSSEAIATSLSWKEVSVTEKSWQIGQRRGGGGGELAETPVDKHQGQDWERANKVWLDLRVTGLLLVHPSQGSALWF